MRAAASPVFLALVACLLLGRTEAAEPEMTLLPASGPCNGSVTARATGLPSDTDLELTLALPNSDQEAGRLAVVRTNASGAFTTTFSFGQLGCDTVARAAPVTGPLGHLKVYVDDLDAPDDLVIYTSAEYALTSQLPAGGMEPATQTDKQLATAALAVLGATFIACSLILRFIRH